ncbi:hypothetical protein BDZ97DRAFT_1924184 [Flammula alnicola]|nr:hypothetical protein BDZ97DRAFT_1924184 [Flammula alnicola]
MPNTAATSLTELVSHPILQPLGLFIQPLYRILICTACDSALLPAAVARHFQDQHTGPSNVQVSQARIDQVAAEWGLAQVMPKIMGPVIQINGLLLIKDCIKCPACGGVYSSPTMPGHYSKEHPGIRAPTFRDLPTVHAQQLNKGKYKTLFEVIIPGLRPKLPSSEIIINRYRSARDQLIDEYLPKTLDARSVSPWLQTVGWYSHVQPFNRQELLHLVEMPKNEGSLGKLKAAVHGIYALGYQRMAETNTIVLQTLNKDADGRISNQPFKKLQEDDTTDQYVNVLVRLLAMLLRPKNHYKLDLPEKVEQAIEKLRKALDAGDDRDIRHAANDILFRMWARVWKKSSINSLGDPTICFVALSMLRMDGGFQSPKNTTPLISKLAYGIRLVFLLAIKRLAEKTNIEDLQACSRFEKWFTEKMDSTFNSLYTLQHLATSLAYGEPVMPRVVWTDRTTYRVMRYGGTTIEFDKLTPLFSNLEEDAVRLWENEVLMGLPLRVDYTHITDDMANDAVGYSFIFDKRNSFFQDRDALAKAILAHPQLSNRFLAGSVDASGEPIWNITELQKWLFSYAQFHGVQITNAEAKGGSPSRGTELSCLEYRNSRTRPRGLYMMGNHLALMCQYHKSSSITGRNKVIPHSLDAVTSDLMIQDLAIARPFAELAAYICYPHDKDVQHRYHSYLFINNKQLFQTPQLTRILKSYTLPVYQVGLGVNDWRHVTASFRRKICPGLEDVIDEDQTQESIQALQSGHSRQTENRIYGVSTETLGGSSDDVLPLFLDASTDWQVACKVVPGGHLLPYGKARMAYFERLAAAGQIKANYTTRVTTMEQVMDRVLTTLDTRLEKQADMIVTQLSTKLDQLLESKIADIFESKLGQVLEQAMQRSTATAQLPGDANVPQPALSHMEGVAPGQPPSLYASSPPPPPPQQEPLHYSHKTPQQSPVLSHTWSSVFNTPLNVIPTGSSGDRFSQIQSPVISRPSKRLIQSPPFAEVDDIEDASDNDVDQPQREDDIENEDEDDDDNDIYVKDRPLLDTTHDTYRRAAIIQPLSSLHIQDAPAALQPAFEFKQDVEMAPPAQHVRDPAFQFNTAVDPIELDMPDDDPLDPDGDEYDLEQSALDLLRRYTGKPDAEWSTGLQWEAIRQIYQRDDDIVVIMATGSGKTMVAILPTLMGKDKEIAIIVLPLVSLITDYKRKFDAMQLPYDHYITGKKYVRPDARFILVSIDLMVFPSWIEYLAKLDEDYDVARLILDESHIPMTSIDYRNVMKSLDQIRTLSMQIVLLTGTCPPSSQDQMMAMLGLQPASTVIFRGPTDRPELQYIRLPKAINAVNAMATLDALLTKYRRSRTLVDRAMIFVPYLQNGHEIARKHDCDFYHGELLPTGTGDAQGRNPHTTEKDRIYHAWYQGEKDIIVATTALSAGNDYPSVRLVVHFNSPIEMISYVQEVSRGGRDGLPTKCVLLPIHNKAPSVGQEPDLKGLQSMHDFIFEEMQCLRYAITKYCDGVGAYCHDDPKRQLCSLCSSQRPDKTQRPVEDQPLQGMTTYNSPSRKRKRQGPGDGSAFILPMERAKKLKADREIEQLNYITNFQMALSIFNASCALCSLSNPSAKPHSLTQCPTFAQSWSTYKVWKKSIKYPLKFPTKSCFFCHIPQIGDLLHRQVGSASACEYPDVVAPIAYTVFHDKELCCDAEQHFGTQWNTIQAYAQWLAQKPVKDHLTNISAVFLWYANSRFNLF